MDIKLDSTFQSFEALQQAIHHYENEHFIELVRRDCKTLDSAGKKYPNRVKIANKSLNYYSLKYTCSKGGKPYKPKKPVTEMVRKSSTIKEDCPFMIRFALSLDGQTLNVAEIIEDHNHACNAEAFQYLPRQRRLEDDHREDVCNLLQLKCNKKLVKHYVKTKYGKIVTLKDLSNLKSHMLGTSENNLVETIDFLNTFTDSTVEILVEEDDTLVGIYFQDSVMKRSFEAYPEVLLCDATFKLNNLRMPLYLLIIINGNGEGKVVATFTLTNENTTTISHMISIFKSTNECWEKTVTIFTDKDFKERKVFAEEFPNANILLCLFHTLKSFRTNISCEAMNINSEERMLCLKVLQELTYSKNEDEYFQHYNVLMGFDFQKVKDYYNKNWHCIRSEWVEGFKKQCLTFNVSTTNALENINQKIKQVVSKMSPIKVFYEDLMLCLQVMQDERTTRAYKISNTKVVHKYEKNSIQDKYSNYVTPYAFKFIERQLEKAQALTLDCDDGQYFFRSSDGEIKVTETECTCSFNINMQLPCCHIFSLLSSKNEDMFSENLINERFCKQYYIKHETGSYQLNQNGDNVDEKAIESNNISIMKVNKQKSILSQHEKYRKSMDMCTKLSSYLSDYGHETFSAVFEQLKTVTNFVKNRKQFLIVELQSEEGIINCSEHVDRLTDMVTIEEEKINDENDNEVIMSLMKEREALETNELSHGLREGTEGSDLPNARTNNVIDMQKICEDVELEDEKKTTTISSIKINPLKAKTVGRPKGHLNTVIGLPKRKKTSIFEQQSLYSKRKRILQAIFPLRDLEYINDILQDKYLIKDSDLERSVDEFDCFLLEPEVDTKLVEKYFGITAYKKLLQIKNSKKKKENIKYFCLMCKNALGEKAIRCDSCLLWADITCTNMTNNKIPYKSKKWFCVSCMK